MTQSTALRTEDFDLRYTGKRTVHALKDVSIDFPNNQLTAIIGPSGCGKSTLLKSLNRLHDIKPNVEINGEVYVGEEPVYETSEPVPELRKRVGYVPQSPTPLPMSIYDNVAYGPRIHENYSKDELDDLVETSLRKVNLWNEVNNRLNAPAAELSVGQIQRLCLARSLAIDPQILLCDEVTSALDPISSEKVEETLLQLKEEYTIVMVTHLLDQAKRLADSVVFLYLGEAIETGDTRSFFEQPDHDLTKEFIAGHATVDYAAEELGDERIEESVEMT